jgi:hypothetical protein
MVVFPTGMLRHVLAAVMKKELAPRRLVHVIIYWRSTGLKARNVCCLSMQINTKNQKSIELHDVFKEHSKRSFSIPHEFAYAQVIFLKTPCSLRIDAL